MSNNPYDSPNKDLTSPKQQQTEANTGFCLALTLVFLATSSVIYLLELASWQVAIVPLIVSSYLGFRVLRSGNKIIMTAIWIGIAVVALTFLCWILFILKFGIYKPVALVVNHV